MYALETVQASLLILAVRAAATFSIFSTQSFHFNIYSFCHLTGNLTLKLCLHQTRVHFIIYQTFSFHVSFDNSIQPLHYIYFFFLFVWLFIFLPICCGTKPVKSVQTLVRENSDSSPLHSDVQQDVPNSSVLQDSRCLQHLLKQILSPGCNKQPHTEERA